MSVAEDIADLEDLSSLLSADIPGIYQNLEQAQLVVQQIAEWLPVLGQHVQELRLVEIDTNKLNDPDKRKEREKVMEEKVRQVLESDEMENLRVAIQMLPQLIMAPGEPLDRLVTHSTMTR